MNINTFITIAGFESLSQQRIFDMAAEHVMKNGKPAMIDGVCSYVGIGCAASVFLDDPASAPICSWPGIVSRGKAPDHEQGLIYAIQKAHDSNAYKGYGLEGNRKENGTFIADFMASMLEISAKYKLNPGSLFSKLTHNPA
jgi:hypothetical protein